MATTELSRKPCIFDGCTKFRKARGYCGGHYRHLMAGRPLRPLRTRNIGKVCTFDGCGRTSRTLGLCSAHYSQHLRGIPLKPLREWVGEALRQRACFFPECTRAPRLNSDRGPACQGHFSQLRRGIAPKALRDKPAGSLRYGYRDISVDGTVMPEHRYLMEQHLGRPLLRNENVHHKNGDRADNRLANLELWVKPQPVGQRVSDLVSFVVEHYRAEVIAALGGDIATP